MLIGRAEGMTVLRARGAEPEAEVPFAGLLTLLRPALGRLGELPDPQARALRTAPALEPGEERDRFRGRAATLSLLAAHAEHAPSCWSPMRTHRPVLVAIDDAHWSARPCCAG